MGAIVVGLGTPRPFASRRSSGSPDAPGCDDRSTTPGICCSWRLTSPLPRRQFTSLTNRTNSSEDVNHSHHSHQATRSSRQKQHTRRAKAEGKTATAKPAAAEKSTSASKTFRPLRLPAGEIPLALTLSRDCAYALAVLTPRSSALSHTVTRTRSTESSSTFGVALTGPGDKVNGRTVKNRSFRADEAPRPSPSSSTLTIRTGACGVLSDGDRSSPQRVPPLPLAAKKGALYAIGLW